MVGCASPSPPDAPTTVAIGGEPLEVAERSHAAPHEEAPAPPIDWHHDRAEAEKAARAAGASLLVFAHADWDVASRAAARDVWPDPRVVDVARGYVALSLDATDVGDASLEHDLATLGIERIPTVLVITRDGTERRLEGAIDRDALLEILGP